MEKINLDDIDFSKLTKLKNQGTKSIIYRDKNICFKIFKYLYDDEKEALYKKFLEIEGISIKDVLLPKSLIMKNDKLQGYTMENFKDSMSLFDYFTSTRYVNCKDILAAFEKSSLILRDIHNTGIICQDLSFDNILIDKWGNIKYCDIDGCYYNKNMSPFISALLKSFLIDFKNESSCNISKNTDRLSLMLSFFYLMFAKELQTVTKKKYNLLSTNIKTLKNMREYANVLVDVKSNIPKIPYIDELIDKADDYVIDRAKQMGIKQKIFKNS